MLNNSPPIFLGCEVLDVHVVQPGYYLKIVANKYQISDKKTDDSDFILHKHEYKIIHEINM